MLRTLLLGMLALPLAAEPTLNLYDCSGHESVCRGLFSASVAPLDGPFDVGGRVVVNGIDLGPSRSDSLPIVDPPGTYTAFWHRGPWVIGWNYCCDMDEDGHLVRWLLDDHSATLVVTDYLPGFAPHMVDINSKGQVIGNSPDEGAYYDAERIRLNLIGNQWADRLPDFGGVSTEMLRINDAGQALGYTPFMAEGALTTRMFLLSPIGVAGPPGLTPIPEPGSALLAGCALALTYAFAVRLRAALEDPPGDALRQE